MSHYIIAIDQGTTSSRAILFDSLGQIAGVAQKELKQIYPRDDWVEHDPEEIWQTSLAMVTAVLQQTELSSQDIAAIGITNQRETTILWDRTTGLPIYPAIVWQDRRTATYCESLRSEGLESDLMAKTGLLLDPYFSGTKLHWLLEQVAGARTRAEHGDLAFGTVDSFLLWRLTDGQVHRTDATNASRTLLFNIHTQDWDDDLLSLFNIPRCILPEVMDSSADFGYTAPKWFGTEIPITGMAGDQHCALFGQCCFDPGMLKSTYGTGCFALLNTGNEAIQSNHKLLTTIAYRLNGEVTYALEGSIFTAGAAVQWLRDELQLIHSAAETEAIATACGDAEGVYLVPAFTGLGAPYWDANARGAIIGLSRNSGKAAIVTATLQSVCYQTRDLLRAMANDGMMAKILRVDGGMVVNNWLSQCLADTLQITVDRPVITETTALGACYLAGLQVGLFASLDDLRAKWQLQRQFCPTLAAELAEARYTGWLGAVERCANR